MENVIRLVPVFKETIWGGTRLKEDFGYDTGSDHTGECWAISAHPNGDCLVAEGEYAGKHLSELWKEHRELFGNMAGEVFPLLIKIIDAKDDLSIQVHPDDAYAGIHENGSLGKTECWYIIDCDPGATIVVGHNAKDHEEVKSMIQNARWKEFIREIPIKKGDFFQINPGTVHAIKKGTLILETQQSSDITYRVYDYDRLQNGKPRQLHIQQSIDVIKAPFVDQTPEKKITRAGASTVTRMVTCPYYSVDLVELSGNLAISLAGRAFTDLSVLEGSFKMGEETLKKGDHLLLTSGLSVLSLSGEGRLVLSSPQK